MSKTWEYMQRKGCFYTGPFDTYSDFHGYSSGVFKNEICELRTRVAELEAEVKQARQTAEYWKAEHLAGNAVLEAAEAKVAELEAFRDEVMECAKREKWLGRADIEIIHDKNFPKEQSHE
jgi:uncharacterized membrane protein YqiK